jgi:hypothetical protein
MHLTLRNSPFTTALVTVSNGTVTENQLQKSGNEAILTYFTLLPKYLAKRERGGEGEKKRKEKKRKEKKRKEKKRKEKKRKEKRRKKKKKKRELGL